MGYSVEVELDYGTVFIGPVQAGSVEEVCNRIGVNFQRNLPKLAEGNDFAHEGVLFVRIKESRDIISPVDFEARVKKAKGAM